MSDRLDRIEAILENLASRADTTQLQIDVVIETQLQLQKAVNSLAKSVQAHCDDHRRHS